MAINKNNYEAYFLDFHERKLSEDQVSMLMAFLDNNPELREEFDAFENMVLSPDHGISFPGKNKLKKADDYELIAYLEGDLDPTEAVKVEKAVKRDEQIAKQLKALRQTISSPDASIVYPGKSTLKRSVKLFGLPVRSLGYAAAAAIMLFAGIFSVTYLNNEPGIAISPLNLATTNSIQVERVSFESEKEILNTRLAELPLYRHSEVDQINIARISSLKPGLIEQNYQNNFTGLAYYRAVPDLLEPTALYAETGDVSEKSLAGKVISGFFNKISAPFTQDIERNKERTDNFSIWDIAEFGVKSVNALGDHNYTLLKQYNEKGNVRGVILMEE